MEELRWEPYAEYVFRREWMRVREVEWWETGGMGYEKFGIWTKNRDRKEGMISTLQIFNQENAENGTEGQSFGGSSEGMCGDGGEGG